MYARFAVCLEKFLPLNHKNLLTNLTKPYTLTVVAPKNFSLSLFWVSNWAAEPLKVFILVQTWPNS